MGHKRKLRMDIGLKPEWGLGCEAYRYVFAIAPMACLLFGVTSHSQIHTQHDTHFAIILDATGLALVATWLACCSLGAACKCILDRLFGRITRWVAAQPWGVLEGRQGPLDEGVRQGAHAVVTDLVAIEAEFLC